MLVVTANWAIGDGTVHGGPPRESAATFLRRLRRAAWRAGFRRDGRYRPLEAVQLVLAGDTFDGLTSLAWQGDVRPWHEGARARAVAERIAAAAARRGVRLLAALSRLARNGLPVPRADARGRPMPGVTQRTPVSVVCLVGDRDRVLEGCWATAAVDRRLAIGVEQAGDSLVIRHGAECDPLCLPPDRPAIGRPPSLGESLAVDLLAEFAGRLRGVLPDRALATLARRLTMASPLDAPRILAGWLESVGRAAGEGSASAGREAWLRSVQHWHARAREASPDVAVAHDVVDDVAVWMESAVHGNRIDSGLRPGGPIEALRPRPPKSGPGGPMVVLGHPPAGLTAGRSAATAGRVCLGPSEAGHFPSSHPWEEPPAVMCHDPLEPDAAWLPLEGHEHQRPLASPLITRVGAMPDEPGIVDAA